MQIGKDKNESSLSLYYYLFIFIVANRKCYYLSIDNINIAPNIRNS